MAEVTVQNEWIRDGKEYLKVIWSEPGPRMGIRDSFNK